MERRYQDHEIRQILDLAVREGDAPAQTVAGIDGLTLRELQEVGREVGLAEDRITRGSRGIRGACGSAPSRHHARLANCGR